MPPILSSIPAWFRQKGALPVSKGSPSSHARQAFLIGLGVDGCAMLSSIAANLRQSTPEWDTQVVLGIGVDGVENVPEALTKNIRFINLEADLEYFRNQARKGTLSHYMDWWREIGMPISGRPLARLALFSNLRDGFPASALKNMLIHPLRDKGIGNIFIFTSLSDEVGSAIMWDIAHLILRDFEKDAAPSITMWLATKGRSSTSESSAYVWQELNRLGNGAHFLCQYNDYDWKLNAGLVSGGSVRVYLVGNPADDLSRIENCSDSTPLLADVISSVLDPAFSEDAFRRYIAAPFRREWPHLIASSIGAVVIDFPESTIREICVLRLASELLWGGVDAQVAGVFDISPTESLDQNELLRFLREIPTGCGFFQVAAASMKNSDSTPVSNFSKEETRDAYKQALVGKIELLLNGNRNERDNQRKATGGKLNYAVRFLEGLSELWNRPSIRRIRVNGSNLAVQATLDDLDHLTRNSHRELLEWQQIGSLQSRQAETGHLRKLFDDELSRLRDRLSAELESRIAHRIILHAGQTPEQMENRIYKVWRDYLLSREQPGNQDILSVVCSRIGWRCSLNDSGEAIAVGFCVLSNDSGSVNQLTHGKDNLASILPGLASLIDRFEVTIVLQHDANEYFSEQFNTSRQFASLVQKNGSPILSPGSNVSSTHIISGQNAVIEKVAKMLDESGKLAQQHVSQESSPFRISVLSVREEVDLAALFKRPRIRRKAGFVYSAEQALCDLTSQAQVLPGSMTADIHKDFAYFLTQPALAELFGKGLLFGFIRPIHRQSYVFDLFEALFFGNDANTGSVLFYHEHELLAAMEDFVIELPARAQITCPLHPQSQDHTLQHAESFIQSKLQEKEIARQLDAAYQSVVEVARSSRAYEALVSTFLLWLELLKNRCLSM